MIQLLSSVRVRLTEEQISEWFEGFPILIEREVAVAALYLEPHGELNEHDAEQPTLFLVIGGRGFVRVGGPEAPTQAVKAGDAVLWPAFVLHRAWTEDEPMQMITVEYSAEILPTS